MDKLSASEAIFGFCGWLTTREEVTEMGSAIECSGIADLIGQYTEANGFADPRDGWHTLLIKPKEEAERHQWDRSGERCVKCGDKDWMGGACSGTTTYVSCECKGCAVCNPPLDGALVAVSQ